MVTPVSPDLRRRSKHGCIDCKISKVRCDELHPSCGTCARRRRRCRGYAPADPEPRLKGVHQRFIPYVPTSVRRKGSPDNSSVSLDAGAAGYDHAPLPCSTTSDEAEIQTGAVQDGAFQLSVSPDPTILCESMASLSPIPRLIPSIPAGTIPEDDAETINVYFNRHPFEQVISLEFVDEMNASVLMVLQDNPKAVGDSLYLIGRVYLEEDGRGSLPPLALERRARTLAWLKVKDPSRELEQMLLMALALGAMEGIDTKCEPHERTTPILITYAALIINKYTASGLLISSLAKYFIRALARHDMIISLSQLRRNSIKTKTWLDDATSSTDRFMGYTTTLMPLLEELCALAEDIRQNTGAGRVITYRSEDTTISIVSSIPQKIDNLRSRIQSWRWVSSQGGSLSVGSSVRLIAHAYAYRAAALLMLYRLIHPAGNSVESDLEAFEMACEVMVHLKAPPEDLRLSTWPALIASCELKSEEDRAVAIDIFRGIYLVRKTGTSLQTKRFVTERVWKARDAGDDWDWMTLSQRYPGECVPL